jgi:hypothetical protein
MKGDPPFGRIRAGWPRWTRSFDAGRRPAGRRAISSRTLGTRSTGTAIVVSIRRLISGLVFGNRFLVRLCLIVFENTPNTIFIPSKKRSRMTERQDLRTARN